MPFGCRVYYETIACPSKIIEQENIFSLFIFLIYDKNQLDIQFFCGKIIVVPPSIIWLFLLFGKEQIKYRLCIVHTIPKPSIVWVILQVIQNICLPVCLVMRNYQNYKIAKLARELHSLHNQDKIKTSQRGIFIFDPMCNNFFTFSDFFCV